jgi:hypothetical protein
MGLRSLRVEAKAKLCAISPKPNERLGTFSFGPVAECESKSFDARI